jgi:hypothetical protein
MYLGLVNFSLLMVFGLAGLVVTCEAPDIFRQKRGAAVSYRDFTPPPNASDREAAELLSRTLEPAHAGQPVVRRNGANQLVADFYSVNGLVRATFLEGDERVRVETFRNSIWRFLDNAHATTVSEEARGPVIRAWAWYIELSIWSLILMTASGLWLGIVKRWNYRWTRISLAAGGAVFAFLYWLER